MPKRKGNGGGEEGGEQGPSSSSSSTPPPEGIIINHRNFSPEENRELEQATIEKYRRMNKDNYVNWSMILYRMNAWKVKPEGKKKGVFDNPEDEILDKYSGLMDFYVDNANKRCSITLSRYPKQGLIGDYSRWLVCPHEKVSGVDCEITGPDYAADHIWVTGTTVTRKHGTFVNGETIPKGERYLLVDGDIIGLGVPHDSSEHWGDDKEKRGFVFKVKNIKLGGEQTNRNEDVNADENEEVKADQKKKDPVIEALTNEVILRELAKFLSYKELKIGRLVNNLWKRMLDPEIFSRTLVSFGTVDYLPFTLSMIEQYYLPNWSMSIESRYGGNLINQFMRVINERGQSIRNLKLNLSFGSEEDVGHLIPILRNLPRLETLELSVPAFHDFITNMPPLILIPRSGSPENPLPIFPSVRHFCVVIHSEEYSIIMLHVGRLFPNIQKITANEYLGNVLEVISKHNLWTTGLKEICGKGFGWYYGLQQPECFNIIRALPNRLTKLKLWRMASFENLPEIAIFESMLRGQAATLKHLGLSFRNKKESEETSETLVLKLPTFPKLKTLEFVIQNQQDFRFQITFPSSGRIRYETDFPQICALRLLGVGYSWEIDSVCNGKAILDIFISKDSDTVSPTMKRMEFKLEESNRRNDDEWYNEFVERFQRMFPHVDYPQFP